MKKVNIGLIGVGFISGIYLENLQNVFENVQVTACSDLMQERMQEAHDKWGLAMMTKEELINHPEIDIVLNLTTPGGHYDICKEAILAGKHVYVEKPLSLTFAQGQELMQLAELKGVLLGGAPDTFMGAGIQTCRKLIDDGTIGKVVGATAFMMNRGHESWHPDPAFYYQKGGGPMFDMGPYYLTALVNLVGAVSHVSGMTSTSFLTRTITSQPLNGTIIDVEVPTYVSGTLRFENGAIGNIITTFDVAKASLPYIEIYGEKGSVLVPDPNTFGGPVYLATLDNNEYSEVALTHDYCENSRGLGVLDMAQCIIEGRKDNRASGQLTGHVLEIMEAIHISCASGKAYEMTTEFVRTPPMKAKS